MRILILALSFGLLVASFSPAEAGKRSKKKPASKKQQQGQLGTNHDFDNHGVRGEYQMPDEALAKVENEKSLGDLLGVRKHFKDRLVEASEQE